MKKTLLTAILAIVMIIGAEARGHNPVSILSTSSSLVYLKFAKIMKGGIIQIKNEKDSVVMSEVIGSRKMIIDFFYKKPGMYKVSIVKGDMLQSFTYELKANELDTMTDVIEDTFVIEQ
jgi:hypothetical protein